MKRTLSKLMVLGCLGLALLGAPGAVGAQGLGDANALCPTPVAPYAITSACAQELSARSVRDAARFAPARATVTATAPAADAQADTRATVLDCPAATLPYGISNECAQALSHSEAQQALASANAASARARQEAE